MDMVAFLPKVPQNLGPAWGQHPERQSCKESHRCGGQASDQAKTSEFQVGHQAWSADVSAPMAPTAGPGGGWVMPAMLETSQSLQGEGTSYVPLGRGPAEAEALSPEGRKLAQRAAQRLDRRSRSRGF